MARSESGERIGISAPFENVSETSNTLHVFNTNCETQIRFSDELSELSVPRTHLTGKHTLITVF